jgi:hypothetical protein
MAALTLLSVVGAFVLYLHPDWAPEGRVHHGVLVEPSQPLADPLLTMQTGEPFSTRAWQGRWTLLRVFFWANRPGYQRGEIHRGMSLPLARGEIYRESGMALPKTRKNAKCRR